MPAFSEGCSGCSKPISPSSDSLHCVNSAISFGGYTPCHSSFHCKCFTVKHYGFTSVLQPPTFHSDGGLTARPLDCRLRKWICETCMLRSQGIPDSHPRHYHLRMLERFRILCIWAHHADSTMKTFGTASNKIQSFEAMLGQEVIPKKFPPSWPPQQPLIQVMWLKSHLHLSENKGGTSSSVGSLKCVSQYLSFREMEPEHFVATLFTGPGASSKTSSASVMSTRFNKGFTSMEAPVVHRATPIPTSLALDLQEIAEQEWTIASDQYGNAAPRSLADPRSREALENLLDLRRAAFLGALTALHYAALYRPGELLLVSMTDFINGRYTDLRAADHAIPPCQAITIRVRTKSDVMSKGSTRHLSPTTKSGLNIRLWSDRLIWIHFALQLPSKSPLFPKTKKTSLSTKELWEITMLPAFEAIRSCSPPCASTGFLKHADPATLQWRSFRRGGYQAMRRASVPRTVRHYMMRWNAKNERRSTTEDMYDDLSPEDTINASSMI